MAWNGSTGANAPKKVEPKAPSKMRGLIALAVIFVFGGFAVWLFSRGDSKSISKTEQNTHPSTIKEVEPTKAVEVVEKQKPLTAEEKRLKEIAEIEARYAGKTMPVGIATHLYYLKNPPKISIKVKGPYDFLPHKSERSIASLVLAEPGTEFLDVLEFGESFNTDFVNALLNKNVANDDDDDRVRATKSAVDDAKKEIARICREEGKKPNEVMNEYAKTMYDLGKFERNVREMISQARMNPDLSDADVVDFFNAANKMREERGLAPMQIPTLAKRGFLLAHRAERLQAEAASSQNK